MQKIRHTAVEILCEKWAELRVLHRAAGTHCRKAGIPLSGQSPPPGGRHAPEVIQVRPKTGASCVTSACSRISPEPKSENTPKSYTEKPE